MVSNAKGVLFTLEAVCFLALTPFFLYLSRQCKEEYTLHLLSLREDSVLAHDVLQAWAENGKLEAFEASGDEAVLKADLENLSRESGKVLSLWDCIGDCICESRKLTETEVILCVGRG